MIHQIDIGRFGSFEGFQWRLAVRDTPGNNVHNFKKLNIIYGRNYAGKTTLSRVFRSLEKNAIPWRHDGASFIVRGEHPELNHLKLAGQPYDIRVYNRDFVAENLGFLTDQRNGNIETFAIVGGENNALVQQIAELRLTLGSVEEKRGLRFDASQAADNSVRVARRASEAQATLDDALRRYANDVIKKDRSFGYPGYNIDRIKEDVKHIVDSKLQPLVEAERSAKMALLNDVVLPEIRETWTFTSKLGALADEAKPLVVGEIQPTRPLQDLLENSPLQSWVREGIAHHKGKRDDCAFCRQALPAELWQTLAEHFNQASERLADAIDDCLEKVKLEAQSVDLMPEVEASRLYTSERPAFDKARGLVTKAIGAYKSDLGKLQDALLKRRASLFRVGRLPLIEFDTGAAMAAVKAVNDAVIASNKRGSTLSKDQEAAREDLRRSKVAEFVATLNLSNQEAAIHSLRTKSEEAKAAAGLARQKEIQVEKEIKQLETQQKDERKGAEKVNELLNHYFGHDGIRLEAVEQDGVAGVKFQIMRGDQPAFNLSEGEGSLIAFCYFMAKLEDLESSGKDLIVYIDDPISSLDSNHVFFVYSVIEHKLCAPVSKPGAPNSYRYKQLFISTHNLDFLKYLKRLSAPRDQTQHFIVERHGNAPSRLSLMPAYLTRYVTEFNYLFHQIHKCAQPVPAGGNHDHFFSFGNNLRKFLEAYLYFKYPHGTGRDTSGDRVAKFFGEDEMAGRIAIRLGNELSHLEESFERGMSPIDIPEIQRIAAHVLAKIKEADEPQYEALMASIS